MRARDYVLAIDQGTTSSRAIVFDRERRVAGLGQREHPQGYPHSGWVEHDATLIWSTQVATIADALRQAGIGASDLVAIGITNQRETTVCGTGTLASRWLRQLSGRTAVRQIAARRCWQPVMGL